MALTAEEAALNIHQIITYTLVDLALNEEDDDQMIDSEYEQLVESLEYAADLIIQTLGLVVHDVEDGEITDNIVVCTINAAPLFADGSGDAESEVEANPA